MGLIKGITRLTLAGLIIWLMYLGSDKLVLLAQTLKGVDALAVLFMAVLLGLLGLLVLVQLVIFTLFKL